MWDGIRNELLKYLQVEINPDRNLLKRRYLWLTPALFKHSSEMVGLFNLEMDIHGSSSLTDEEGAKLLLEMFIGCYSTAVNVANEIVQKKTKLKANACRHVFEDPLGITLEFCEEKFKCLGLDFKSVFDIYAGYDLVYESESRSGHEIANWLSANGLARDVEQFHGIKLGADSVPRRFANRVIVSVPRLDRDWVEAFAERNLIVPAVLLALDGLHLPQKEVDAAVGAFLQE